MWLELREKRKELKKQKAELQAKRLRNGGGFDENLQNTGDQEMGGKELLELKKGERSAVTDREVELRQLELNKLSLYSYISFLPWYYSRYWRFLWHSVTQ